MFEKVGKKLMTLSFITTLLGCTLSFIAGIALMALLRGAGILLGIIIIALGILFSWLNSLSMYALGLCADKAETIKANGTTSEIKSESIEPKRNKNILRNQCEKCFKIDKRVLEYQFDTPDGPVIMQFCPECKAEHFAKK